MKLRSFRLLELVRQPQWLLAVPLSLGLLALSFGWLDRAQAQQPQEKKPAPAQQKKTEDDDQQPIRVGTQLVNVLFSVSDKQNRYINDLTKEDIQILEDGKAQQIFTFKKETDLPLTMALLIDVSGSEKYVLPLLKETGQNFFRSVILPNKDTAAIVKFEGEPTLMQGLTSSLDRLRKALEEVAYIEPPPVGVFGGPTPPINSGSRQGGTSMYDAVIATASDLLAGEAGRKTMILLTDGQDTTSRMKMSDAINDALKAETSIYAIGVGDPAYGGVNEGKLRQLCEATGGRAYFPKGPGDLDRAFAELEKDLRQQYLIAYEPDNAAADGGFRKIEVRVSNRNPKEIKIRHRRGYYAPKA
jgi:VWFA-related protein